MKPKLRIGVMLDELTVPQWMEQTLKMIHNSDFAELTLVILDGTPAAPDPKLFEKWRRRVRGYAQEGLYSLYVKWDYKRSRYAPDAFAKVDLMPLLGEVAQIHLQPRRKRFTDEFSEADVEGVRNYDLDVIIRFGFRIIKGGILTAPRYGIWSYHHGDNREYRGGPPMFWEMYERKPVCGTILQILTEKLDAGQVIFRSLSATVPTSLYLSRNESYWKTAEFIPRRLRNLYEHGLDFLTSLPTYHESTPYTKQIYRTPGTTVMVRFLTRQLRIRLRNLANPLVGARRNVWWMAVGKRTERIERPQPRDFKRIPQPPGHFYADPMLYEQGGKHFLFFEDYSFGIGKACIRVGELDESGNLGNVREALSRPYHLSYPFVFRWRDNTYMIPESCENRTVELFRADSFPDRWIFEKTLLCDVSAVDATLYEHEGRLWMFLNIAAHGASTQDELNIFYAKDLHGPWIPHRLNPVVSDVTSARPAGALFTDAGRLIRPSQDSSQGYGYAINFNEVVRLTPDEYEERRVLRFTPEWLPGNKGIHTFAMDSKFVVIDGKFEQRI
jgi:hypothetical protein